MEFIGSIVSFMNVILWDYALLFLLVGTGIFFTFKLKFVQITHFKDAFKRTFGGISLFGKKAGKDGMSSFQALATAIAAQIGTGNIAGAATAVIAGGPGAIFWMWVAAFFGMATIFAEATAAQEYKTKVDEEITGGPVYYIRAAVKGNVGKVLAGTFAVLLILALGFMGNMVQSNSIGSAFEEALNIPPFVMGIVLAAVAGFIFIGGMKRIASFAEKVVPIMAVVYIVGCVVYLSMNASKVGGAFRDIFVGAFDPKAIAGGVLGATIQKAMRYGVARGLFSNEAGMGSTAHAHAVAKVDHPCEQGAVAMMGVFIDTFIVLTLSALVMITSGLYISGDLKGVQLAQGAFSQSFGNFGTIFVAICLLFFAFTTIVGWYFFGEANVKYLFGQKAVIVYAILVIGFIFLGTLLKVDLVWDMADMFNGLMVIPNLIGLLAVSGVVSMLYGQYKSKELKNRRK